MKQVCKEEFFASTNRTATGMRAERDATYWEDAARCVVGKCTPGYMCRDAEGRYTDQKQWFLPT